MARKHNKHPNNFQQTPDQSQQQQKGGKEIKNIFEEHIKDSLTQFNKLSEEERKNEFGDKEFIDQFREFFKDKNPNLLDQIESKEKLKVYLGSIEKLGFKIQEIKEDGGKLSEAFKESLPENKAIEKSLQNLKDFCGKKINGMPANIFEDFATEVGFDKDSLTIDESGEIKHIENIQETREKFLAKKNIKLNETQNKYLEKIVNPDYTPTERFILNVAIKKIKQELPKPLQIKFDAEFGMEIDIFSPVQDLRNFKTQWINFLETNKDSIDKDLAKKLDKIIVTNGDIRKELIKTGVKVDSTRGFSEQEMRFRRVFNKLATRQLFKEIQETKKLVNESIDHIADTFKGFPPYLNELFKAHPYNYQKIIQTSPSLEPEMKKNQNELTNIEEELAKEANEGKREELKSQRKKLLQEENTLKRKGYIAWLETKKTGLGQPLTKLVDTKFDFTKLSTQEQQEITNILVKEKIEDTIKNKVPDLLDIDQEKFKEFIQGLFDLSKKTLSFDTTLGPINLNFLEKGFLGGPLENIGNPEKFISEIQNLPLNLKVKIDASNEDFFEENILFKHSGLFNTFHGRNGTKKLNDSYKVKIKKDGKIVEGYLSQYPPTQELLKDENDSRNNEGKENRYLYSHPVTQPSDAREVISRNPEETDPRKKLPVVILQDEEIMHDIEIVEKEINLNGEGIGSLIMGYVLGQKDIEQQISPEQEKKLAEKFKNIETYKDKNENKARKEVKKEENKIDTNEKHSVYEECIKEWKSLKGISGKKEENGGFEPGAKLIVELGDSSITTFEDSKTYMTIEITEIHKDKGTFTIKTTGGETKLGKYEGKPKTLPLTGESLKMIKDSFGENIFKLPKETKDPQLEYENIKNAGIIKNDEIKNAFGGLKRDGNIFKFNTGINQGKEVKYFSTEEVQIGEQQDMPTLVRGQFSYQKNPDNTFTVEGRSQQKVDEKTINRHPFKQKMDLNNFILFIAGKKLSPRTEEEIKAKEQKSPNKETAGEKKRKYFSLNNLGGFFKGIGSKITDGIKKYDSEKTEELTEMLINEGDIYNKLARFIPSARRKGALGGMAAEQLLERDNRVFKKIEKRQKFYESDPDFGGEKMRGTHLKPYLTGNRKFVNHYQAAGMLLATIKKGKGPYSRNSDRAGKGMWIKILLGESHRKRYTVMRDKKIKEIQEKSGALGGMWSSQVRDDIVKLEMKYLVHNIDGRELAWRGKDVEAAKLDADSLGSRFSKKFAGSLDEEYNKFFSQSSIKEGYEKNQGSGFEFARFEYFRLLADRPQQALGFLKVMAEKAVSKEQRKTFKMAVMSGMISGIFINNTESGTQSRIKKICRTIGFMPGMRVGDFQQQEKLQQLFNIATDGDFKNNGKYKIDEFKFGQIKSTAYIKRDGAFRSWLESKNSKKDDKKNIDIVLDFCENLKSSDNMIQKANNPKTPEAEKDILNELITNSTEKDEEVDKEVKMNPYGLSQSVFTKSESIVGELIQFSDGSFKGSKDENQGMQIFRSSVAKEMPTERLGEDKQATLEYFLKKFKNRFEARGFGDNDMNIFMTRLRTAEDLIKNKGKIEEGRDILRYSIVGTILMRSGSGQVPAELRKGLEAFVNFFKENITEILKPDTIKNTFGEDYIKDSETPLKLGDWPEFLGVIDSSSVFAAENRDIVNKKRKMYKMQNSEYINNSLYEVAKKLEQKCNISNRFVKYGKQQKTITQNLSETLGRKAINIKNPEIIDNIRNVLKDKKNNEGENKMTPEERARLQQERYENGEIDEDGDEIDENGNKI